MPTINKQLANGIILEGEGYTAVKAIRKPNADTTIIEEYVWIGKAKDVFKEEKEK